MQTLKMAAYFAVAATFFVGCALFRSSGVKPKSDETTVRLYEQADTALPAENRQMSRNPAHGLETDDQPIPHAHGTRRAIRRVVQHCGRQGDFPAVRPHGTVLLDEMTTRLRGQYSWS